MLQKDEREYALLPINDIIFVTSPMKDYRSNAILYSIAFLVEDVMKNVSQ